MYVCVYICILHIFLYLQEYLLVVHVHGHRLNFEMEYGINRQRGTNV